MKVGDIVYYDEHDHRERRYLLLELNNSFSPNYVIVQVLMTNVKSEKVGRAYKYGLLHPKGYTSRVVPKHTQRHRLTKLFITDK